MGNVLHRACTCMCFSTHVAVAADCGHCSSCIAAVVHAQAALWRNRAWIRLVFWFACVLLSPAKDMASESNTRVAHYSVVWEGPIRANAGSGGAMNSHDQYMCSPKWELPVSKLPLGASSINPCFHGGSFWWESRPWTSMRRLRAWNRNLGTATEPHV